ncbi:hypothetical protein GOV14_01920, partial [Candidatus Pacearchaeota archaeon]|nr:hypothetical protein [Candidatus Pacearchaeota archaeon]
MKIAVDIDEVIAEFLVGYLELFNKKYNKNVKTEDVYTYNLWEALNFGKQESIELADEYHASLLFDNIEPVFGSQEGLKKLDKDHEIFLITSRPPHFKEKTDIFLKNYFSDLNLEVVYLGDPRLNTGSKTKSDFCFEQGFDLIIEDNIHYSISCAQKGLKVILMDKPWNKEGGHENISRV